MTAGMDDAEPPAYIGLALGITSQEWSQLGLGDDPAVAASDDIDVNVHRISALLLVRIVAWLRPRGTFEDMGATSICRKLLVTPDLWPESITLDIIQELKKYVKVVLGGYRDNPYHNVEHCYHVTVSTNKLMDIVMNTNRGEKLALTFGFRDDPLMQFALLFSALVHDVEHGGIPNRQLVIEDDELAIRYNDQSIAEHRSLYVAFSELLKPDYGELRRVVFPQLEDYRRFRSGVVAMVLATDLASPDRAQISKSKWKEAFGDPYETVERKVLKQMERRASISSRKSGPRRMSTHSIMSELTLETPGPVAEPLDGLETDESVSETPESSENGTEDDDLAAAISTHQEMSGKRMPVLQSSDGGGPVFRPPQTSEDVGFSPNVLPPARPSRGGDGLHGKGRTKRRPRRMDADQPAMLQDTPSVQSAVAGNLSGMALKFHRRLSSIGPSATQTAKRHRNTRLGLLRTVDLTGESIETYQHLSARPSATGASTSSSTVTEVLQAEEIDELRETVIMETIIKAADVAHNLQSWDQMAKWSNRLFLELKKAFVEGRGEDPQGGWFSNQAGFLEAYLLPLARKLDDTGVFGDTQGAVFAQLVEANQDRWNREGMALTANVIMQGHMQFPEPESDDEARGGFM